MSGPSGAGLLVAACLSTSSGALACECEPAAPAAVYARASVLFVGVLVDAHTPLPLSPAPTFEELVGPREVEAHFYAYEMLKGTEAQVPAIVHLRTDGCGLGKSAAVPAAYLIATDGQGRMSSCDRSHLIEQAPDRDPDVIEFRKLRDGAGKHQQ